MTCEVCSAPALSLKGSCAFCRTPLSEAPDATGLLDYIGARLPQARVRRGLLGRGPVKEVRVQVGSEVFKARLRKEALELDPEREPEAWVDRLLAALSRGAARDPALRDALSQAGWAQR